MEREREGGREGGRGGGRDRQTDRQTETREEEEETDCCGIVFSFWETFNRVSSEEEEEEEEEQKKQNYRGGERSKAALRPPLHKQHTGTGEHQSVPPGVASSAFRFPYIYK